MDSPGVSGPVGNFTSIRFASAATSTPYGGTAVLLPGVVRLENFDEGGEGVAYPDTSSGNTGGAYRESDVDIEPSSEGGYDVGWITPAEWLNYSVDVRTAGAYTVTFRVASSGAGGTFHLELNGANVTGAVAIPNTGGWQIWQSVMRTVNVQAGRQTARLVMDTAGGPKGVIGNIAWMRFDAVASAAASTPYTGTPISLPGTLQAENFDNGGEGVAYHDTTSGNAGGALRSTDVDIEPTASGGSSSITTRCSRTARRSCSRTTRRRPASSSRTTSSLTTRGRSWDRMPRQVRALSRCISRCDVQGERADRRERWILSFRQLLSGVGRRRRINRQWGRRFPPRIVEPVR